MNLVHRSDTDTLTAYRALFVCLIGSLGGLLVASFTADLTYSLYLPGGLFFLTVFSFLVGDWGLNGRDDHSYDPASTFLTFSVTSLTAASILYFFFIRTHAGPFAEELFTVPNVLANIAFGLLAPALLASIGGLTYHTARKSIGHVSLLRVASLFAAITIPLSMMIVLETLFATWILTGF